MQQQKIRSSRRSFPAVVIAARKNARVIYGLSGNARMTIAFAVTDARYGVTRGNHLLFSAGNAGRGGTHPQPNAGTYFTGTGKTEGN